MPNFVRGMVNTNAQRHPHPPPGKLEAGEKRPRQDACCRQKAGSPKGKKVAQVRRGIKAREGAGGGREGSGLLYFGAEPIASKSSFMTALGIAGGQREGGAGGREPHRGFNVLIELRWQTKRIDHVPSREIFTIENGPRGKNQTWQRPDRKRRASIQREKKKRYLGEGKQKRKMGSDAMRSRHASIR